MPAILHSTRRSQFTARFLPFVSWLRGYQTSWLRADLLSGLTVALVLIPQSMAYAQLAGLPAYYGLYAAFLPPIVASLFGSSAQLATGPVAVVSLMTATALEPLAAPGSTGFMAYAILLALLVGVFQFLLGSLRLGMVVNLLSHPVINGFTNAAALIIAASQLPKLLGVSVEQGEHQYETVWNVVKAASHYVHGPTIALGILAFAIMVLLPRFAPKVPCVLVAVVMTTVIAWTTGFERNVSTGINAVASPEVRSEIRNLNEAVRKLAGLRQQRRALRAELTRERKKSGQLSRQFLELKHHIAFADFEAAELKQITQRLREQLRTRLFVPLHRTGLPLAFVPHRESHQTAHSHLWRLRVGTGPLDASALIFSNGGAVVGHIPRGLPPFEIPTLSPGAILELLPMMAIISLLGFMEAISVAKAMAARTGERIDPDQELIGQGLANIVGAFFRSYPVSGSFSRSAINLRAGAKTGLSNIFSSGVVVVTLLALTPLLYYLPQSVLAAIIMVAVVGLIDFKAVVHAWQAQPHDGVIAGITFIVTLIEAPHLEWGILLGIALSLGFYLLRTMKPDVALLSKYVDGSYRNAARHSLELCDHIAVIRFNGSLFFSNVSYLEEQILERVAAMPKLRDILIVGNGINEIDSSGVNMLSKTVGRLREAGYDVFMSGLNDTVLDVLKRTGLEQKIGEEHLFRSVASALEQIFEPAHAETSEKVCPLVTVRFRGLPVSTTVHHRSEILEGPPDHGT